MIRYVSSRRWLPGYCVVIVASAGLGVTGCVRQPDVQIIGVTEPPTRLRPGSSPVAADALRVGGRKAAVVVRYYLSADSKQSKDDHLVGTRETAELAAKAVDSGPAPLTIPDD